jgi:hypothetical protein
MTGQTFSFLTFTLGMIPLSVQSEMIGDWDFAQDSHSSLDGLSCHELILLEEESTRRASQSAAFTDLLIINMDLSFLHLQN